LLQRKTWTKLEPEGKGKTMTIAAMSAAYEKGGVVGAADVSYDEHERLALEMLAVEAGDAVEVERAMRKIIDSAGQWTDVALVLVLAMAHAGDRALSCEAPLCCVGI
jgi:hypothetical protein